MVITGDTINIDNIVINSFTGQIDIDGSDGVEITNNYIGLDTKAKYLSAFANGIDIHGESNNIIIGNDITDGNIFGGSVNDAYANINITSTDNGVFEKYVSIRGNYIGIDPVGNIIGNNTVDGIELKGVYGTSVDIGGPDPSHRNIISSTGGHEAIILDLLEF
ncbi:MAG: hypothetical protein Q9M91_00965 [Candidatus Dojkabacteria bacterium]|nr:hypothetical protein [Candidatus Dojkabacteria bacterium]MDQ7020397.1 hypothetical protein [Candidatus Dojkabacteria bacterium]